MSNDKRAEFEAAVIERFKESGLLEVEIRVECLGRSGEGYYDGSVDAYWFFWKKAQASVVVELPEQFEQDGEIGIDYAETVAAIEAAGGMVKQ
jgi:hypothetical protein